jgi:hypothetical protein
MPLQSGYLLTIKKQTKTALYVNWGGLYRLLAGYASAFLGAVKLIATYNKAAC